MKSAHFLQSRFLALSIVTALAITSCRTVPKQEQLLPSTAMKLTGDARCSLDGKTWKAVKIGKWIPSGSVVQTAENEYGWLVISLGEGIYSFNMPVPFGGLCDPAIYPADLLRLNKGSTVKLRRIFGEKLPNSNGRKEMVELSLEKGTIQGNVEPQNQNSEYEVWFKGGVLTMRRGTFRMDESGNVDVLDGQGEIRFPARNLTNRLSAFQHFDAKNCIVTNFPPLSSPDWRHDIWLSNDPFYEPWATPPHVKPGVLPSPQVQRRF